MEVESSRLFETVLKNSEDTVRAIEGTKIALIEHAKASGQVAETLRKVAETNEKQTETVNNLVAQRVSWEREKQEMRDLHERQVQELKSANQKMQKMLLILALLLFIGVGGFTLLEKLKMLGLLGL